MLVGLGISSLLLCRTSPDGCTGYTTPHLLLSCLSNPEVYHQSWIPLFLYQIISLRSRPRTSRKGLLKLRSTLPSREQFCCPPPRILTKTKTGQTSQQSQCPSPTSPSPTAHSYPTTSRNNTSNPTSPIIKQTLYSASTRRLKMSLSSAPQTVQKKSGN